MADYYHESYHYPASFPQKQTWLLATQETREYANGDIVHAIKLRKGVRVLDAIFSYSDELDEDASPTATGKVRLYNGATAVNLIAITAAQLGTANGGVLRLTEPAALGHLVEDDGYELQFVVDAAVANPKTAIVKFGALITPVQWGTDQRTIET